MLKRLALVLALPLAFGGLGSCLHDPNPESGLDGGAGGSNNGSGGNGSGGRATGSGGSSGSGGTAAGSGGGTGSGGNSGSGGQTGSGGNSGSGGQTGSGGSGSGGTTAGSGGGTATGGRGGGTATGGRGGGTATGGRGGGGTATGGRAASGGATSSGGTTGSGGTASGGSGSGGSGSGGTTGPTACSLTNHTGSGSFTHYNFAMGTGKDGNGYRTACGYYGTANGTTDTVENIATMSPAGATYFAAIPGTSGFNSKGACGECVSITGQNGTTIIATIIDECPYGSDGGNTVCQNNPSGHLDLSQAAFDRLGYPVGNPTGTNWKFVPCPVSGNVKIRIKSGNANEIFIENIVTALKTVVKGGESASRQSYGAWHFNGNLASGDTLTLTDIANRTISVQVMSTAMNQNQDTGKQFPACQ